MSVRAEDGKNLNACRRQDRTGPMRACGLLPSPLRNPS